MTKQFSKWASKQQIQDKNFGTCKLFRFSLFFGSQISLQNRAKNATSDDIFVPVFCSMWGLWTLLTEYLIALIPSPGWRPEKKIFGKVHEKKFAKKFKKTSGHLYFLSPLIDTYAIWKPLKFCIGIGLDRKTRWPGPARIFDWTKNLPIQTGKNNRKTAELWRFAQQRIHTRFQFWLFLWCQRMFSMGAIDLVRSCISRRHICLQKIWKSESNFKWPGIPKWITNTHHTFVR